MFKREINKQFQAYRKKLLLSLGTYEQGTLGILFFFLNSTNSTGKNTVEKVALKHSMAISKI